MATTDWSLIEVEAVVSDYFAMLAKELSGQSYNKTSHRNALSPLLNNRSHGSIERKHQNISAILIKLGYPYISGYKRLGNYQRLLADAVASRALADSDLRTVVQASVEAPALVPTVEDILARMEDRPPLEEARYATTKERQTVFSQVPGAVNYLEREARNASLGLAGELFVLNYERARLIALSREKLAESLEHVPSTTGDGTGFDIRSFEKDGSDRFIEVKTTAYGKQTPIFLSANELRVSREREDRYHLYRVYHFRQDPRLFMLAGAVDSSCRLEPVHYRGHVV